MHFIPEACYRRVFIHLIKNTNGNDNNILSPLLAIRAKIISL
jgi:hypothetical protein